MAYLLSSPLASRRRFLAALCLFAFAAAALPLHAAERYERGLLWRVEGKGAAPSHVFGTIHLADPRVTKLPPEVAREFGHSRSVTLEAVPDAAGLAALINRMLYADGRDLPGVAGAELFGKAAAIATGLGIPEPALRSFKPWAVALILSTPRQDPSGVLDFVLARMATEQGKTVNELEGLGEQAALFEGMAEGDQVAMLRHAVANYERMPKFVGRLVDAYLARDLAALWRISQETSGEGEEAKRLNDIFVRQLLHGRHERMVERAEPRLKEGGAFIAVGALHLYGDRGVLALLEKRGYRVTRVY